MHINFQRTTTKHSSIVSLLEAPKEDEEAPEETKRLDSTTSRVRRWLVRILLLVFALLAILVAELRLAPIREMSLDSATVDISQSLPHATFHVQFQHGSRLSTVTIQSLHCDLEESGAVEIQVMYNADIGVNSSTATTASTSSSYTIHATCPEEDVQAHADLLWKLLTQSLANGNQETTGTGGGVGDFKCQLGIRIYLAKLIPYSHTVTIDNTWAGNFKTSASPMAEEQSKEQNPITSPPPSAEEPAENNTSIAPITRFGNRDRRRPAAFALRQLNVHNLSMAYRIDLPDWIKDITTNIQLILPSLHIDATDNETASSSGNTTGSLTFGQLNASFFSEDMLDSQVEDNWASFSLSCPSSGDCPWFSPVIDWYRRATHAPDGRLLVDVAVNGGQSFLERLLGPRHVFYIDWSPGVVDGSSTQGHRKVTSAFNDVFLQEAASCLSLVSEQIEAFDFAWCWFLNTSQGFQVVGRTDFYDYATKTIVETQWDLDKGADTLAILTSLSMEAGEPTNILNISGDLLIDWSGKATVKVSANGMNDGTWLPFETAFRGNGQWDSVLDEILILEMEQGQLIFENDLLADAVGSLVFNADEMTLNVTLNDPAEGLACGLSGGILWDEEKLEANSLCEYAGNTVWDMGLDSGITWNFDETRWTLYMELHERVSSFKTIASLGSSNDTDVQYSMDMQLDGEQIIGAVGGYVLDSDFELFEFSMDDSGRLNYSAIIRAEWDTSVTDLFELQVYEMSLRQDQTIHMNSSARVALDYVNDSISISATDIDALEFSFDSITRWEDQDDEQSDQLTLSFEKIFLEWKSGRNIDVTGELLIDFLDSSSHLELTDVGYLGIFFYVDTRWDNDDLSDKFSLYLDQLFLGWEEETRADLTGNFTIDLEEEPGLVGVLTDETVLEMTADVDIRWPDLEDVFVVFLDSSSVVLEDEILLDASGYLEVRDDSIEVQFDDPDGLGAKGHGLLFWVNDVYTQYFSMVLETLKLEWDGDTLVDLRANISLDEEMQVMDSSLLYPRWSLQMTAQNTASPTFMATLGMTDATSYTMDNGDIISNADQRRMSIERVLFQFDDETYIDQEVVFEYDGEKGSSVLTVYCASDDGADLEMNMNMTIAFRRDGDASLRMIMDHMNMGWRGTTWIDAGDSLQVTESEESPSQSPTNQNENTDSTDTQSQSPTNQNENTDSTDIQSQSPTNQNEATDFNDLQSQSPTNENEDVAPVTVEIQGIIMRLEGAEELDEKGMDDFKVTLEKFYVNAYSVTIRRYLKNGSNVDFQTEVAPTGQHPDESGNNIKYDQKLTFLSGTNDDNVAAAESLVLKPLSSTEGRGELVGELQASNEDAFGSVTAVQSPEFSEKSATTKSPVTSQGQQNKREPESNSNTLVIAICTVAAALLFCGGFGSYYWYRLRKNHSAISSEMQGFEDPSNGSPLLPPFQTEAFRDENRDKNITETSSKEEGGEDDSEDDEDVDALSSGDLDDGDETRRNDDPDKGHY